MKLYRNSIIVILVIAVLGALMFFVSKYTPDAPTPTTSEEPQSDELLSVYAIDSEQIAKIQIKNAEESYTVETDDSVWTMNNDSSIRIKQTAVKALASSCASISVKKVVSDSSENSADYGFSTPTGYAIIHLKDGGTKTITIGSKTLDGFDYYIMISGDSKIYMKNAYGTEQLIPKSHSLRDLSLIAIDSSDLSQLKHVSFVKQGKTAVKLEYVNIGTEEAPKYNWKMLKPVYADMNGQNFTEKVVTPFEDFQAAAVIEDHAKDVKKYGLSAPYAEFTIKTDTQTLSMIVGNETDAYRYAAEKGNDTVYLIPKSSLTFLDVAYIDLMSNLIHVEYITDVNSVEIVAGDTRYSMEIKGAADAETYYINDVKIDKSAFSKAYQAVIGLSLESLDFSAAPTTASDAYIRYSKKDGSVVTVQLVPVNERNFRVLVNGEGNSITSKKNFESILNKLQETIEQAK